MGLDNERRQELASWLVDLQAPFEKGEFVEWVSSAREEAREELLSARSFEPVRAGLIRLGRARAELLDLTGLEDVIEGYLQVSEPTHLLHRPPAWVGVSAYLFWGDLDRALQLAAHGFGVLGQRPALGDLLWAMAEVALEEEWLDVGDALMDACLQREFSSIELACQAKLAMVLSRHERVPQSAALRELLEEEDAPEQVRVQSGWMLAMDLGKTREAALLLERILQWVEPDSDVAARIKSALAAQSSDKLALDGSNANPIGEC